MNDVEDQILAYPNLSVEKQREIEAYVESNPKWAPLLRDVRALEGLPAGPRSELPSDPRLATYVTVQHLHPDAVPAGLRGAFSALEDQIERDADLRREVDAARRRMKKAEAAVDPVAHFEALTDHNVEPAPESASSAGAVEQETETNRSEPASPSGIEVFLNLPGFVRAGMVAVVVLMVAYGGLYGVSRATQSPLDRLAAMEVSAQVVNSYTGTNLRSATPSSDTLSVDQQYLDALSSLRTARVSTLGLFPRYDSEKLAGAKQHLTQVLGQVDSSSFLALESHFYLGKIALAQREVPTAQRHLKVVVRKGGRRADEAYDILRALQRERTAENG